MLPRFLVFPQFERRVLFVLALLVGGGMWWMMRRDPDPPSLTGSYTTVVQGEFVDAGRKPVTCSCIRVSTKRVRLTGLSVAPLLLDFTSADRGRVVSEGGVAWETFQLHDGGSRVVLMGRQERLVLSRLAEVPTYQH